MPVNTPPAGCSPAAPTLSFDLRSSGTCLEMLNGMLAAYYQTLAGNKPVTVRFKERWMEYSKATANDLLAAYQTLYRQCPYAVTAGLPDLNPNNRVRRGPPSRGFQVFPRF